MSATRQRVRYWFETALLAGALVTALYVLHLRWATQPGIERVTVPAAVTVLVGVLAAIPYQTLWLFVLRTTLGLERVKGYRIVSRSHLPLYACWLSLLADSRVAHEVGTAICHAAFYASLAVLLTLLAGVTGQKDAHGGSSAVQELWIVLLLTGTLFLFGGIGIYVSNPLEFYFDLAGVLSYLVGLTLVSTLGIMRLLALLPPGHNRRAAASCLLFVLGLFAWLLGNVTATALGVFDGTPIPASRFVPEAVVDALAIAALSVIAVKCSRTVLAVAGPVSLFVVALQASVTLAIIFNANLSVESIKTSSSAEGARFQFSKSRNVILIVLDEAQSDVFDELFAERTETADVFQGFTRFRNATACYSFTELATPRLFLDTEYDNSVPKDVYLKAGFAGNSLTKLLAEQAFQVDVYPWGYDRIYLDPTHREPADKAVDWNTALRDLAYLHDAVLFRISPNFVKPFVYNNGNWLIRPIVSSLLDRVNRVDAQPDAVRSLTRSHQDSAFIQDMYRETAVTAVRKTFKFYHLRGLHVPLNLDENNRFAPLPLSRDNYKRSARGYIRLLDLFLSKLRQCGVFDNSLILIVGDHGSGRSADMRIPPGDETEEGLMRARGLPLLLVKRVGSTGAMRVSEAPASLSDIPATVASELGIRAEFSGRSVFDIEAQQQRTRYFYYFAFGIRKDNHVNPMIEWAVKGHSLCAASWSRTGRIFKAPVDH